MIIRTINPATEIILNEYSVPSESDVHHLIEEGYVTFESWKKTSFSHRAQLFLRLAELLLQKIDELSLIITNEMGKPVQQSRAEIEKCVWVCKHYAEHAEGYLQDRIIQTDMAKTFVTYQASGIIFAIMPWNFPFWQVLRCAVPTIMAGNAVILKHAHISLGAGNALADLFIEAGFPHHLFQHLILDNDMSAKVIAHNKIAALSFTGSTNTGRLLASLAAQNLKKSVLELGGNDPYLVLDDADIDLAARCIVTSRLNNCGQVCIAAKRIIAVESVHDALVAQISLLMADYEMGDPLNSETKLGPMAQYDLREALHEQVVISIQKGAELITGGILPVGLGFYYPPTLLLHVKNGMPAFDEELFGPVISVTRCKDEDEAIKLANQSEFGLSAAIFTRDLARGEEIATHLLNVGACFINNMVASDPRVPFGGIKNSGFGRELSREGILEFVNTKTIAIQ